MSEQRAPYHTAGTPPAQTVELRLLGDPAAVEALEAWLQERLELRPTGAGQSRKTAGHVLRYLMATVPKEGRPDENSA